MLKINSLARICLLHMIMLQNEKIFSLSCLNENDLELIVDYANWRQIHYVTIILNTNENSVFGCGPSLIGKLKKIQTSGLTYHASVKSWKVFEKGFDQFPGKLLGVLCFEKSNWNETNGINFSRFDKISWLVITTDLSDVPDKLSHLDVALNTDLVVAERYHQAKYSTKDPKIQVGFSVNRTFFQSELKLSPNLNNATIPQPMLLSAHHNGSEINGESKSSASQNESKILTPDEYRLYQSYKIRRELNHSLVVHYLGVWTKLGDTTKLTKVTSIEKRRNFHQFAMKLARIESTQAATVKSDSEDDDSDNETGNNFDEFLQYFSHSLNCSYEFVNFQKLGLKGPDGIWTDLLGSVTTQETDLALEAVIGTQDRIQDVVFSHKILDSRRNIYIKPQESNELRDIFLVPFATKLIWCVILMSFSLAAAILVVSWLWSSAEDMGHTETEQNRTDKSRQHTKFHANHNHSTYHKPYPSEALVWSWAIMTMQGAIWTPKSCSGKIILLFSMAYALVIFNSYAAFITSILSVELPKIRSLDDLLESDYRIGYSKNSQDEIYLRAANDTKLQQIYLRGYLHSTENNITEGLLKTTRGHFGFFASGSVARQKLRIINGYRCIYDVMEIPIGSTKSRAAFPMSKKSPYRNVINLSLIKMYESGIFNRIQSSMVPNLPRCQKNRIFRSAHLHDLMTAFGILSFGISLAIFIVCGECLFAQRRRILEKLRRKCSGKGSFSAGGSNKSGSSGKTENSRIPFSI